MAKLKTFSSLAPKYTINMQVDNLILEKCLGKGAFGEVFLTKMKGDNSTYYATKKYEKDKIEKDDAFKYLNNEIDILKNLKHPNIVKFIDIKKTKKHFYIVMEYCNGGELSKALEKYLIKYGKPFNEELVQYLMRQIISAFKTIHNNGFMHRDIKLENILLHYNDEQDKKNLNLMKAQIKIIDFGFACKINKNSLTYTAIGNPINMDPIILKKLGNGKKFRGLGYDQKADIWSLGAICYEMLIGRAAFDAEDMDDLVQKIESGKYKVPTNLSKEVVGFLNGMLQYNADSRLNINQLSSHDFIIKNVKEFHPIDLRQVSSKLDSKKRQLVIDVKHNRSIWAIFNPEDENKLINMGPGKLAPIREEGSGQRPRILSLEQKHNVIPTFNNPNIMKTNTFPVQIDINNANNIGLVNPMYNQYNNQRQQNGPMLPRGPIGIPGNPYQYNIMPQMQMHQGGNAFSAIPTSESQYSFSGGIYK